MTKKHIFICGSKSIGQYGGYETFVDKLIEYTQADENIQLYVACKANGQGSMDETKLPQVTRISDTEFLYRNAKCFKMQVPDIGPAVAVYYDYMAVRFFLRYCREHHIESPILYILTCRIGPFTGSLVKQLRKLGGSFHLNPDGHEWKRSKWPPLIRKYWKISEKQMVKHADWIVCDSRNIESYIQKEYSAFQPQTTFIAYGAETEPSPLSDTDSRFISWLQDNSLEKEQYYLIVGRFVPENNFETMIREFMASDTNKKLAIIANQDAAFFRELEERLHFLQDPRIRFAGTVYNQGLLRKIRENAYGYLHGHEVGGTNPSLLEALGATNLNLLLDVCFNREVGEDTAVYWSKEHGNLAVLIHQADSLSREEWLRYGERAKDRIRNEYSWSHIADLYLTLWRNQA